MKRLLGRIGAAVALVTVGCGESVLDPHDIDSSTRVEAASAPIEVPVFIQFDFLNPCSGLIHTVTFTGTARIHEHDGQVVVQTQRTITTSDGFQGRGTDTFVDNGKIQRFTLNDMLSHESGARIRAHFVQVIDLSTTPPTVRVFKGTFDGTICVGA